MTSFLQTLPMLSEFGIAQIALVMGIFARISGLVFFLPGLGERVVPTPVRLAAAMSISLAITPILLPTATPPGSPAAIAMLLAAEAISGALIGFSIRIAVFAIQTAGAISSQSLSLAQMAGSGIADQAEPPVGTLLMMAGVTLAVSTGLHFKAVAALVHTYEVIPLGVFPGADETGQWSASRAGFAFAAALSLALPFVVLGFVYNLAIGAANRAMPQLMVAFVGAPAITFIGFVLIALAAPHILDVWLDMLDDILETLSGVV